MARLPSKQALKEELVGRVTLELQTAERAHQAAGEGATHEEARPEDDKDTRALEQSYLARGQARRVEELREKLAQLKALPVEPFKSSQRISAGALITAEEEGETLLLFLAPCGGGTTLANAKVQVVTPSSPLGAALLGKRAGESCEVHLAGRTRELELQSVQ